MDKRILRKVLAGAMAFCMVLGNACPCFANETGITEEEKQAAAEVVDALQEKEEYTYRDLFGFDASAGNFSVLDASNFYDAVASLDKSAFGQLRYEVPTSVNSSALLNLEYDAMLLSIANMGHGQEFELEIPEFTAGYSGSIMDAFNETYGDLSDKFNMDASMPEGWNMSDLMNAASAQRDEAAGNFKDSEMYKAISESIGTNQLLVEAQKTLEDPELKDMLSLQNILKESMSDANLDWQGTGSSNGSGSNSSGTHNPALGSLQDKATNSQFTEDIINSSTIQESFNSAVSSAQGWVDANLQSGAALTSQEAKTRLEKLEGAMSEIISGYEQEFVNGGGSLDGNSNSLGNQGGPGNQGGSGNQNGSNGSTNPSAGSTGGNKTGLDHLGDLAGNELDQIANAGNKVQNSMMNQPLGNNMEPYAVAGQIIGTYVGEKISNWWGEMTGGK